MRIEEDGVGGRGEARLLGLEQEEKEDFSQDCGGPELHSQKT